jgi:hypothetical protein
MNDSADRKRGLPDGARLPHRPKVFAQVGEWLKPTDCKSVPPSEVRRFESFPVHQLSRLAGVKPTLSLSRGRLGASWRSPERSLRRIWQ